MSSIKKISLIVISIFIVTMVAMFSSTTQASGAIAGDGQSVFKAKCATCHGADGSGNTPMGKNLKVRDLRSSEVQNQSDDQLFNIIAQGKGGKMPAFGKTLDQDTMHQLVGYIRKLGNR